jgi:hypothetical protein
MQSNESFFVRRKYTLLLLIVLGLLAVCGVLLVYGCLIDYEVLEKGQILSYSRGFIYKLRFCHTFTAYIEPEVNEPLDLINGYFLTGVAFISLTYATVIFINTRTDADLRYWFYVTLFLGMSYLAADEWFGFHENLGHNLQFLKLSFFEHPDDMIIALYSIPSLLFLYVFRKLIWGSPVSRIFFGLAFATFVLCAVSDALDWPIEEFGECVASAFVAAAVLAMGMHHTGLGLQRDNQQK